MIPSTGYGSLCGIWSYCMISLMADCRTKRFNCAAWREVVGGFGRRQGMGVHPMMPNLDLIRVTPCQASAAFSFRYQLLPGPGGSCLMMATTLKAGKLWCPNRCSSILGGNLAQCSGLLQWASVQSQPPPQANQLKQRQAAPVFCHDPGGVAVGPCPPQQLRSQSQPIAAQSTGCPQLEVNSVSLASTA